jgi:sortase A
MSAQSPPHADNERPAPAVPAPRRRWLTIATGVTGEVLVTAGILLGLFVVWQLFYTDILSGRTQHAALEDTDFAEDFRVPPVTVIDGVVNAADTEAPIELIPDELKVYSPTGAPITAEPAAPETFGRLWVPRWGSDYVKPISQGTDREVTLDRLGIGHYQSTAMPGEVGNFAIAGHRTSYGKPFADVDKLIAGDALIVQTEEAWFVYRVTASQIVLPHQVEVIAPVPNAPGALPTTASITLTSCHPKFSAEKRFIVHGELEYWAPTGHGYPQEVFDKS